MKFSKATDYGLLLTVHVARLPRDEVTSVRQVAADCNVSERFLANIVHRLASAGILASRRGVNGGIRLARPAADISVGEVVQALEGPIQLFDCQSSPSHCVREDCCAMKSFWADVQGQFVSALSTAKIGDFLRDGDPLRDAASAVGGRAVLAAAP